MHKAIGMGVAGLALLTLALVLLALRTSPECGSAFSPVPASELRFPLDCAYAHNERWHFVLLAGTPGLVLTVAGLVVAALGGPLGAGGRALLVGLVGLSIALAMALPPVLPGCESVLAPAPAPRGRFNCLGTYTEYLNASVFFAAPAVVLCAGGWLLHRNRRSDPPAQHKGGGLVLAGVAVVAVAVALAPVPIAAGCGSVLSPSAADEFGSACLHHERLLSLLLIGAPGLVLTAGGLVVTTSRIVLGAGGWVMMLGVAALSMAAVVAVVPSSPQCGSVLAPASRTEYRADIGPGYQQHCPPEHTTRLTWVLLFAGPGVVSTAGGWLLRRTRRAD